MRVKASEISADYVTALRARNVPWSGIARMTGAAENDLRRFHGGQVPESVRPVAACNLPLITIRPVEKVVPASPVLAPVKKRRAKRKPAKIVLRPRVLTKADRRLSTLLVAAGMPADDADIVVRLYRAEGVRLVAGQLVSAKALEEKAIKDRVAAARSAATRLGIGISGGQGRYGLEPDSRHFIGRLESVNAGAAR